MRKNDMNLLERYRSDKKLKSTRNTSLRVYAAILIVIFLLIGAFALKLYFDDMSLQSRIASLQSYVNDPTNIKKLSDLEKIQNDLVLLEKIENQVKSLDDVLDYKPKLDHFTLDVIYYEKPKNVTIDKIEYSENTLKVQLHGSRSSDMSNYALRLQRTFYFADVSYEGYKYDQEHKFYRGELVCILKGGK